MANVPESATFDAGIYQIEITDAVIGGVNGISNLQAKGLANRTTWLKAQVDALNALKGMGIQAFSAGSTYAGGQQSIYQKNIWQANTAITPGAFNPANWTKQLGDLAALNSDPSKVSKVGDSMTGQLVIVQNGTVNDLSSSAIQIQATNDALIWFHRPGLFGVGFGVDANNNLIYGGTSSSLGVVHKVFHDGNCPKLFTTNGWQKLASGLIIQWGRVDSIDVDNGIDISFPITFPNQIFIANAAITAASPVGDTGPDNPVHLRNISNSGMRVCNANANYTINAAWFAIGY